MKPDWVFAMVVVGALCGFLGISLDESVTAGALLSAPTNAKPANGDFDGDGCMDIGLKSGEGTWYIDYCSNGYGGPWDAAFFMYGDASVIPVPADYDGDGKTDLAIKDTSGMWAIDYAANGFGVFDEQHYGYGLSDAIPVPADYGGDGKADLSIKDSTGFWGIDLAADGFNGWNYPESETGFGGAEATPVPANYDGDVGPGGKGRADRAVKTTGGEWKIDYSSNGRGRNVCHLRFWCFWYRWDLELTGYGFSNAVPVPADYDLDGYADLAIKDDSHWRIDRHSDGFGTWNEQYPLTGGFQTLAVPGVYTASDLLSGLDLAVQSLSYGYTLIDRHWNGIGGWDVQVDNPNRPALSDSNAPRLGFTRVRGPNGVVPVVNGHYQLTIGQKYTVEVELKRGATPYYTAGIAINPALRVPASLRINNRSGTTAHLPLDKDQIRRVSIVCSEPGSFPLGFLPIDGATGNAFNPDYGVRVNCQGPGGGNLFGRVTKRVCLPAGSISCGVPKDNDGHYSTGSESSGLTPIVGATVAITPEGGLPISLPPTDTSGFWGASDVPVGVPLTIKVSKPGFSDTIAVNVVVPGGPAGGLELDTPLEEEFAAVRARGMVYRTYLDYSRGRTLIHVVTMNTETTTLKDIHAMPVSMNPITFKSLVSTAREDLGNTTEVRWPVVMNAALFKDSPLTGEPAGYVYSADYPKGAAGGYVPSLVPCSGAVPVCTRDLVPMLAIQGTGLNQAIEIIQDTERDFLQQTNSQWNQVNGVPLWDRDHDGLMRDRVSDVSYAVQCGNQDPLYRADTKALAAETHPEWAGTAIGVIGSTVYLVVVDGEGIWGGNGASGNQIGTFFRYNLFDKIHGGHAMLFDSGVSTELVLWGRDGPRHVNTITGEDNTLQMDPYSEVYARKDGVPNYLIAGTASP